LEEISQLAVGRTLVVDNVEERGIGVAAAESADSSGGNVVRVVGVSVNAVAVKTALT
jgi:hypothetical protein